MWKYRREFRALLASALACVTAAGAIAILQAGPVLADDGSENSTGSQHFIPLSAEVDGAGAAATTDSGGSTATGAADNFVHLDAVQNRSPVEEANIRAPISLSARAHNFFAQQTGLPFAKIVLAVDCSGSMGTLFSSNTTQRVLSRLLPVMMDLTSDHRIDCWLYGSKFMRVPDITPQNLSQYVKTVITPSDNMGFLGAGNEEGPLMRTIALHYGFQPTIVVFLTDTGVSYPEVKDELRASERLPIFWQFVGLDPSNSVTQPTVVANSPESSESALEKKLILNDVTYQAFNDMRSEAANGQPLENSGFFPIDDYQVLGDRQICDRIMGEFTQWAHKAERFNIVPPSPPQMMARYQP